MDTDPVLRRAINYIKNANKLIIQELNDGYLLNYYFDNTQREDGQYQYRIKNLHTDQNIEKYLELEQIGELINHLLSKFDADIYDIYPDERVCHYDFAIIYKKSLDSNELGPDGKLLPNIQKEILEYISYEDFLKMMGEFIKEFTLITNHKIMMYDYPYDFKNLKMGEETKTETERDIKLEIIKHIHKKKTPMKKVMQIASKYGITLSEPQKRKILS